MAFDYSDMVAYTENFEKMTVDFERWLGNYLLTEGLRFIKEVKLRTPVDTGDLRNHWKLDGWTREGDVLKIWFVNSMNYASFVEYGHAKPYKAGAEEDGPDWVDGYFMMTASMEVVIRSMPNRFRSAFRKYLQSTGVN